MNYLTFVGLQLFLFFFFAGTFWICWISIHEKPVDEIFASQILMTAVGSGAYLVSDTIFLCLLCLQTCRRSSLSDRLDLWCLGKLVSAIVYIAGIVEASIYSIAMGCRSTKIYVIISTVIIIGVGLASGYVTHRYHLPQQKTAHKRDKVGGSPG